MLSSLLLFLVAVFAIPLHTNAVTPQDWEGTYNDPIYGGNIALCVSLATNGVYYGQALFSNVGYMRGTINPTTLVFSGSFYTAGFEVKRGTFSLTLGTSGSNATMTGPFSEYPGVGYNVVSTRWSSVVPDEMSCFRSDTSILTTTGSYDFTGVWFDPSFSSSLPYYLSIDNGVSTGSYVYFYPDGTPSPGVTNGQANFNGQAVSSNWYETADTEGMDILVAKNATYAYMLWWYFPRMSEFDYSYVSNPSYFGRHYYVRNVSVSASVATQKSSDNMCYALWTAAAEASCSTTTVVSADDDDGDNGNDNGHGLQIAILVLVVFLFFTAIATLYFVYTMANRKQSMASQQQEIELSTKA